MYRNGEAHVTRSRAAERANLYAGRCTSQVNLDPH
jgi:hypothetical protein